MYKFLTPGTRKTVTCENRLRFVIRSNPVNTDTEGVIESARIDGVFVSSGLIYRKCISFLTPGTRKTVTCENRLRFVIKPHKTETEGVIESVCINRLSVLSGLNLDKMQGLSFPRAK